MKRILSLVLVVMLICSLAVLGAACGKKEGEQGTAKQLKLYFVNQKYVETGEEADGVLVPYDGISITLPTEPAEGATDKDAEAFGYTAAISNLWQVPQDLKGAATVVNEDLELHNISCRDGVAYVDIDGGSLEKLGGSTQEEILIGQIVETLINSFDEIQKVQFLVDGKETDSLLGHVDTSEPFDSGMLSIAK